jgi:hypothetical protein
MKSKTVDAAMGLIIAALIAGAAPAPAQDNEIAVSEGDASPAAAPSLELLEFLGEWETDEGHWIDPTQFDPTPAEPAEMENDTQTND